MFLFDICGATHRGCVRTHNDDHILVGRFVKNSGSLNLSLASDDDFIATYGLLLSVADGIGGAAGGEMASRIALLTLEKEFYAAAKTDGSACAAILREAAYRANATLREVAKNKAEFAGMGATVSGICLTREGFLEFNAGDSRVYRYRNGLLKQLTQDDSLAAHYVRSGEMTFSQAKYSSESQLLVNYLGNKELVLSLGEGPQLRNGDSVLICSDGLYGMVDDDALAEKLRQMNANGLSVRRQTEELINDANRCGGNDNISVILMTVRHEPR